MFLTDIIDENLVNVTRRIREKHTINRWLNGIGDRADVRGEWICIVKARVHGDSNCTAVVVCEDQNQVDTEVGDGIFERADYGLRNSLAGISYDKKIAEPEIKNDLGGQP